MVSIQRRRYQSAIAKSLTSKCSANRRIKSLQEALGGIHENVVERRRGGDLRKLDIIRGNAIDRGGAVDIILTKPGGGGEDFVVS